MEDEAEKEPNKAGQPETPGAFLMDLDQTLRSKQGVDAGLADILATHLLTTTPAKDAVAQAKEAILMLANQRAATLKSEADNG